MNSIYNLDLTNEVIAHFEKVVATLSINTNSSAVQEAIIIINQLKESSVQPYVLERIAHLESMINMISDKRWELTSEDENYILSALTYFTQEDDIIPDDVPVVGLLDDCIVIDIVVEKIKQRLKAFSEFRLSQQVYSRGGNYSIGDWHLNTKRESSSRLRNRRNRNKTTRRTRGSSFSIC